MLAAVYFGRNDVRVQDWPSPSAPPPGWVTVAPTWCGICGTDLEELTKGPSLIPVEPHPLTGAKLPLVLGHEGTGRVIAAGDGTGIDIGVRVGLENTLSCRTCEWCLAGQPALCSKMGASGLMMDGALSEAVNVPAYMCAPLDPALPDEAGAIAEPLAVCVRAVRQAGVDGHSVQVFGGGAVGLLMAQVARASGASSVLVRDPSAARRKIAAELGLDAALPGDDERRAEVVFECTGVGPGFRDAIAATSTRGTTVIVGVHPEPRPVDLLQFLLEERRIIASLSHNFADDYEPALELMRTGRVDFEPIVTDRIELPDVVEKGFRPLLTEPEHRIKVLVRCSS